MPAAFPRPAAATAAASDVTFGSPFIRSSRLLVIRRLTPARKLPEHTASAPGGASCPRQGR